MINSKQICFILKEIFNEIEQAIFHCNYQQVNIALLVYYNNLCAIIVANFLADNLQASHLQTYQSMVKLDIPSIKHIDLLFECIYFVHWYSKKFQQIWNYLQIKPLCETLIISNYTIKDPLLTKPQVDDVEQENQNQSQADEKEEADDEEANEEANEEEEEEGNPENPENQKKKKKQVIQIIKKY